jgi:catechol 2,3-dioxygenase-like lactoylglutathione lyase family enzyme
VDFERDADGVRFVGPGGLRLGLVRGDGEDYDLDHVVLRVPDPERAADELAALGFDRSDGRLAVAGRHLQLLAGEPGDDGRPLLNHLALLVDSARAVQEEAGQLGIEIDDIKDAANTFAVFVRGPAGIRVEYVEHKPGFALV